MDTLWTRTDISEYLLVHLNTVDRIRKNDPTFPEPTRIRGGNRTMRWHSSAVIEWFDRQSQQTPKNRRGPKAAPIT